MTDIYIIIYIYESIQTNIILHLYRSDSFFIPSNNFRVNSRRINLSASAASDRRLRIDDVAVVPPSSVRGCVLQI